MAMMIMMTTMIIIIMVIMIAMMIMMVMAMIKRMRVWSSQASLLKNTVVRTTYQKCYAQGGGMKSKFI